MSVSYKHCTEESGMKISVLGNGHVGSAVFERLKQMRELSEIMLIGRNEDKILGEIEIIRMRKSLIFFQHPKLTVGAMRKSLIPT